MKQGLPQLLKDKMKKEICYSRDMLRNFGRFHGYDSSSVDRKCRLLTQQGYIKPEMEDGFIKRYY